MAARNRVKRPDFAKLLIEWYGAGHRDLPWRRTADPYRIWVSEIMLQQTRAQAVIPYYERFLARFPTVESLAAAQEDEVLALWSGLGYYSRARNLRRAAGEIAAAGGFPRELRSDPRRCRESAITPLRRSPASPSGCPTRCWTATCCG